MLTQPCNFTDGAVAGEFMPCRRTASASIGGSCLEGRGISHLRPVDDVSVNATVCAHQVRKDTNCFEVVVTLYCAMIAIPCDLTNLSSHMLVGNDKRDRVKN